MWLLSRSFAVLNQLCGSGAGGRVGAERNSMYADSSHLALYYKPLRWVAVGTAVIWVCTINHYGGWLSQVFNSPESEE